MSDLPRREPNEGERQWMTVDGLRYHETYCEECDDVEAHEEGVCIKCRALLATPPGAG